MDQPPIIDTTSAETGGRSIKVKRRPRFSFRLLDLLLLTTLVAAWLPYFLATRQFDAIDAENTDLRRIAEILVVDDPTMIHLLKVRSHRHSATAWKMYLPESSNYELRFACDDVSTLGFPEQFDRFRLTPGEHRIAFLRYRSSDGYVFKLFVDDELAILRRQPSDWIARSSGSSYSTGHGTQCAVGDPLVMMQEWIREDLPGFRYVSGHRRHEVSNKGSFVWIAPADMVHPTPPHFVTPQTLRNFGGPQDWGFRNGIRVRLSRKSSGGMLVPGTLQVVHTGLRMSRDLPINQLAIKTRVDGQDGYASSTSQPSRAVLGTVGLSFNAGDSKSTPPPGGRAGVISKDVRTLRLFFHCEAFSNGTRPILEVRFEKDTPDRIGFRIHAAEESEPMRESILTMIHGSFAQLRRIHLADNEVKSVDDLFPEWSSDASAEKAETSSWQTFSKDLFPRAEDGSLRRAELSSNVSDYSKVNFTVAATKTWQYKAFPARQSWLFSDQTPVTVAVRSRQDYRDGSGPIPGGPALEDFELRLSAEPSQWIWYEVEPVME